MIRLVIRIVGGLLLMTTLAQAYPGPKELLERYAPYIIQELDCTHIGDYITSFDYDGDYIGTNNWDNLGYVTEWICFSDQDLNPNCSCIARGMSLECLAWICQGESCPGPACYGRQAVAYRDIPAYVYGSVIETGTHFYLCYALFHPADDFWCHESRHENDLEGMIMMVHKDGSEFGKLIFVELQAHWHFYQYKVPGAEPPEYRYVHVANTVVPKFTIDKTISCYHDSFGIHPVVYVEGGGHGIWADTSGGWWDPLAFDGPYVHYLYTGTPENSTASYHTNSHEPGGAPAVGYALLPISAEFWQRRRETDIFQFQTDIFGNMPAYSGDRMSVENLGMTFNGDDRVAADYPQPPWAFDDRDDGFEPGDWFMDSAYVFNAQFIFDPPVSLDYIFHPFLLNDIGGDFYGKLRRFDESPAVHSYTVKYDVTVPSDNAVSYKNSLNIDGGLTIKFLRGTKIVADGLMRADGSNQSINFRSSEDPSTGIKLHAQMRLQNGGSIKFP